MNKVLFVLLMATLMLPACDKEVEVAPPEQDERVEKTAGEIYDKELAPLIQEARSVLAGNIDLDAAVAAPYIARVNNARAKCNTANGKNALTRFAKEIEGLFSQAKQKKLFGTLFALCQVYDVLEPNNSKTPRHKQYAEMQLNRPKVAIKGFFEDESNSDTYVFLEIKLHGAKKALRERVREGDEFLDPPHTLRLVEIIGNNKSVRIEYLAIEGDSFVIDAP